MKRFLCVIVVCLLLSGCFMPSDPVLDSLGEPIESTLWTWGIFGDYTDYGKRRYSGITQEKFQRNQYFSQVSEEDIPRIQEVVENFEEWVADGEISGEEDGERLAENYDFTIEMICAGDYFYLDDHGYYDPEDENYLVFFEYDLYYFAIETQTLYFFHNNY